MQSPLDFSPEELRRITGLKCPRLGQTGQRPTNIGWQLGIQFHCAECGAERLLVVHHDLDRDDDVIECFGSFKPCACHSEKGINEYEESSETFASESNTDLAQGR